MGKLLLVALALLGLASPGVAQRAAPAPTATISAEQFAAEKARADKAERDLEIQNAVHEIKAAQSERTLSAVESMVGAFGVLTTLIVIFFALRTEQAAVAAARKELEEAKAKIDELQDKAEVATATVEIAATKAAATLAKAEAAATKVSEALASAEAAATGAAGQRDRAIELQREAASIVENMKASGTGEAQPVLTKEQTDTLRAATKESAGTPEENWTIDQFKVAIGKAMYVDEDWEEGLRLATAMALTHPHDPDARIYATNRRGDAEYQLARYESALQLHDEAVSAAGADADGERLQEMMWAKHGRSICLSRLGRPAEAEAELRSLVPLRIKINGEMDRNTLSSRLVLASVVLDQGRIAEAKAELQVLQPMFKSAFGAENPFTLTARHQLALATLQAGDPRAAEAQFQQLLAVSGRVNGMEHPETLTSRHVLAVAMLEQGRTVEAETDLRSVLSIREPLLGAEHPYTLGTRHELARAMFDQGRLAEADAEFRAQLAIRERVMGAEHRETLITRYYLGRIALDQGRAADAHAAFEVLLPLDEATEGPNSSSAYITRFNLALALLEMGNTEAAVNTLKPIPAVAVHLDWTPKRAGRLAYVRGRVADALGDRAGGDSYLAEAHELYSSALPGSHHERRILDAYVASRRATDAP